MRGWRGLAVTVAILGGLLSPGLAAAATTPCVSTVAGVCRERLTVATDARVFYYRTYSLGGTHPQVTRAVIVSHGTERDPLAAFSQMVSAARATGNLTNTAIIAPHFPITTDSMPSGYLKWSGGSGIDHGWKQGDDAVTPAPVSSFTVLDRMLARLGNLTRFPNLRSITVVGHSGGGQLTQKYALGGRQPAQLRAGLTVQYVAANPGSYTYLNPYRPNLADPSFGPWLLPTTCPGYDHYKYGLVDRNRYLAGTAIDTLRTQYLARRVVYLLGSADTSRSGLFDASCQADVQGRHRFERGTAFYAHLSAFYPGHAHRRVVVEGVGHSPRLMYGSATARAVLFP